MAESDISGFINQLEGLIQNFRNNEDVASAFDWEYHKGEWEVDSETMFYREFYPVLDKVYQQIRGKGILKGQIRD